MALSTSTDFTLNRDQLIKAAFRLIGVYPAGAGEEPTSQELTDASETINLILKSWIADGLQLWIIKQINHTLVANTQSYTVGLSGNIAIARPDKIIEIYYIDNANFERSLDQVSRNEYFSLSDKASQGSPTLFYYDPQLTTGTLYLWPVLGTIDATTPEQIRIFYQKPFDDLDESTHNFEFPEYYLNAIKWNLAVELGFEYGLPNERLGFIIQKAMIEKQKVMEYDQEPVSIYIQPESEHYRGY